MYICVHNHPFVSTIRNALVMAVFPMGRGWLLTAQNLGVLFERLSFNVERRGMENKYSGMLAWEEGILYL